ncbi:YraN family protein [Anatilimnocola sp. NA78]|uniref:YraN family protein n=1 Tax=Anatilimnocola sp. NA78 TaxID=3415683 RepID=UPI003CE5540C
MRIWNWLTSLLATWRTKLFPPRSLGQRGELLAARYLRRKGYIIIAHSHRDHFGEIDLVAVDGRTVVFVEVKTRTTQDSGHPADAVDLEKQRRLTRAAKAYRKRHDLHEVSMRFDVIAITWPADNRQPVIEHFVNAFEATD